jgi:hypothetical protein
VIGQGARDRHPLLLTARQLVWPVIGPARQPNQLEQLAHSSIALPRMGADEPEWHFDVFGGRQDG